MRDRIEVRTESGEHTPWEICNPSKDGNVWTVLCDGWCVAEVWQSGTDEYFASKVRREIPMFVHNHLPTKVSASLDKRWNAER